MFEDDRPRKAAKPGPGEDLSLLSIEELEERIEIYRAEINRLERDIEAKRKSKAAADSFFRL